MDRRMIPGARGCSIAVAVAVITLFLSAAGSAADIYRFPRRTITVDGRQYRVLVADRSDRREQGLSGTIPGELEKHNVDGMLFVFDRADEKIFQAWYMQYDLVLLSLNKAASDVFTVTGKTELKVGTIGKITGRYILEIPRLLKKEQK